MAVRQPGMAPPGCHTDCPCAVGERGKPEVAQRPPAIVEDRRRLMVRRLGP